MIMIEIIIAAILGAIVGLGAGVTIMCLMQIGRGDDDE